MKKGIISILLAIGLGSLYSCSNEESKSIVPKDFNDKKNLTLLERISLLNSYEMSQDAVLEILSKFENLIINDNEVSVRSTVNEYQIDDKFYFSDTSDELMKTKSFQFNPNEFPVYKIKINKGDRTGYALVSADARHPKVIAFIPVSEINDQEAGLDHYPNENSPAKEMKAISLKSALNHVKHFNLIKDSLRFSAIEKLKSESMLKSSVEREENFDWLEDYPQFVVERTDKRYKLTKTHWHQAKPFNCKLGQSCPNNSDGRYWVGCGVVAIAQAIAHCEPKLTIQAYSMDWANIKKTPDLVKGKTDKKILDQVGTLMKWIGETAKSEYTCESTSTNSNAIENILPLVGMKCDKRKNWDWNSVAASLRVGNIVHVSAYHDNTKDSGHGWIMDGFIHIKVKEQQEEFETIYVHNNFGWKGNYFLDDNGYYEIEEPLVFTVSGGQNYDNRFRIHTNISKK